MTGFGQRRLIAMAGLGLVFGATAAIGAPLDYDLPGMGGMAAPMHHSSCADCRLDGTGAGADADPRNLKTIVAGLIRPDPARLGAATGDQVWLSGTARPRPSDRLPGANGWRNIGLPTPADEPVAMTVGVSIVDEQDIALDSISQNKALNFPSTRLLAGFRFKLGRAAAD